MFSLIFLRKTNPLQLNKSPSLLFSITTTTTTTTTTISSSSRFFSSCTNNKPKTRKPNPYKPNSDSYDQQIKVAGCSRDFTTLHRLLNQRAKDKCFNTTNTFKFLINEKDPNSFLLLFDQLLQTLSRLDQGSPRKSAFDLLIASLCKSKSNRIQESHRVINIMIEGNYGISSCTFHPLLNALTRKRRYDEAWGVLKLMRENGILVDITAYNYILTAHCFDGDLKAAAEVLEKILEDGLKEDQKVYDAMILGACRVGKVEGALKIFRRMEETRVSARYSTHAHIINGLLGLGYFAQAVEFVLAVGGRDERLDSESFGHLGNCLIKKKRVEEAKVVFGEMEKRGLMVGVNLKNDYMRLLSSSSPSPSPVVVADCQSEQV